ncbi:MAG: F0F1 ATP synthase subunit A [Lachnospiraceae bacterium]|nr:F0F1 ATP synthase subunit A [Lachnospiraceae bacterium]
MVNGVATGFNTVNFDSPDFYIHELYPLDLFGTTVYITTTHICTFIVIVSIMILAVFARRSVLKTKDAPSKFATAVEIAIGTLLNFVNGTMGKAGKKYVNYVGTLFLFVFFSNISGLFGLRPPTADYGTTLCIALVSFIMIQYAAVRYQKWGYLKGMFEPIFLFFPINVISEVATPVSLSLRLFGNILAGTVMMALYYGMLPIFVKIGIPSALHIYFDLFSGAIQTYVFCMLTMTFVADKRNVEA